MEMYGRFKREQLKKAMNTRKVNQKELSKLSNIAQPTLSYLMNSEESNPTYNTVQKLAVALGVEIEFFYSDKCFTMDTIEPKCKPYIVDKELIPYIQVSEIAYRNGLSADILEQIVNVLIDVRRKM